MHVTHVLVELECDCRARSIKALTFRTYGVHGLVPSLSGSSVNWLDVAPPSVSPLILTFACNYYGATGQPANRKAEKEEPAKVVSRPNPETEGRDVPPGAKPWRADLESNWTRITRSD